MKKKRNLKHWIGMSLVCLLTLLSGCNDSDDAQKIFTGKTWKLTYITLKDQHRMLESIPEASVKKLFENKSFFTITFSGVEEAHTITGLFETKVVSSVSVLNGTWSANGKTNEFFANVKSNESDPLAKEYIKGLNSAHAYSGDEKNLYIYYKEGQQTYSLVFRVAN